MAKNYDSKPIPGHEHLTMGDQMHAAKISDQLRTDPKSGKVENPRREYLKNKIQARAQQFASKQARDEAD